jgi:hypothetical protein
MTHPVMWFEVLGNDGGSSSGSTAICSGGRST